MGRAGQGSNAGVWCGACYLRVAMPPADAATPSAAPGEPFDWRRAVARRSRWIALCCGVLLALVAYRALRTGGSGDSPEAALAAAVARHGVRVSPDTVRWLARDPGPLLYRPVLFLGAEGDGLDDVWYAEVRGAGRGTVLDVAWRANLTGSSSASEEQLVRLGADVAFATRVGDAFDAVTVLDLRGEPDALTEGWPWSARLQAQVTNLQRTGRRRGVGVRRYGLPGRPTDLTLRAEGGRFVATGEDLRVVLDPAVQAPLEGAEHVRLTPQGRSRTNTTAWLVDTVREVIGPEPIEWLENRVFNLRDRVERAYHGLVGEGDAAAAAAADLGMPQAQTEEEAERIARLTVTDPELGWPPPPLEPPIEGVEGEGRWVPVVDDPYVNAYPGAPPAFYQTFVRADPERLYTRVYITLWDPRQVQLRIQAGLVEPESATGERGSGRIPRDPETLRRLVAAFNGGFQALHGEFGMMAEGRIYLPPKPWAATVAVFSDGRVGMGSWPAPSWEGRRFDEEAANRQIPEGMAEMRQNLTSVVEDGRFNPWSRWWWGAAPRGAQEQTNTIRTGLCITEGGFMAFFWGERMAPEALGEAMRMARCTRGMHLDMNPPHSGFEFFRPIAPGEEAPPLEAAPRADREYDGELPFTDGWRLRARRAVASMQMDFPRYSLEDARDFFYLTLRPILPGPPVANASEGEGAYDSSGLPNAGWPPSFARATVGETVFVRIDPHRAVPAPLAPPEPPPEQAAPAEAPRPLAYLLDAGGGPAGLVARPNVVGWRYAAGRPGEADHLLAAGGRVSPRTRRALGVDPEGFLVYVEGSGVARALAAAAIADAVDLGQARLAFVVDGALVGVDGYTVIEEADLDGALAFEAPRRPEVEVLWPDNPPMPYGRWGFLQGRRVRYFPSGPPRFARPPGSE
jgi:hypothetical protein